MSNLSSNENSKNHEDAPVTQFFNFPKPWIENYNPALHGYRPASQLHQPQSQMVPKPTSNFQNLPVLPETVAKGQYINGPTPPVYSQPQPPLLTAQLQGRPNPVYISKTSEKKSWFPWWVWLILAFQLLIIFLIFSHVFGILT